MRVLLVCHKPAFPVVDGGTFDSAGLAQALTDAGQQVDVLAMAGPKWREGGPSPVAQEVTRVDSSVKVMASLLTLARGEADAVARYRSTAFATRLRAKLAGASYDIVQFDGCATAQYMELARGVSDSRVILRAHNDEADLWLQRSRTGGFVQKWFLRMHAERLRRVERRVWTEVDGIAAITSELAAACEAGGAPCVRFVPVPQIPSIAPSPCNHNLFHLGPLDWWPNREGLNWFLDSVWPIVHRSHPELEFRVAGRGSKEFVASMAHAGVHGEGEVGDAAEYMTRGGILVAPTRSGSGMPVKVAQAMSLGKAIVATSVGARGLGAQAPRDFLRADSPEEFAAAICRLVADSSLAAATGHAAWAFASEHFDRRAVGTGIVDLYHTARKSR